MPNILTPAQECSRGGHGFRRSAYGEVVRCKHGRVFMSLGYSGYWQRLTRFGYPFRYRRAVRALKAAEVHSE